MSLFKKRLLSYSERLNDTTGTSHDSTLLAIERSNETIAGRIESLRMINFMCHSNLELKLNSRINFITGRNGSGKSAIMAALILVLGGSASVTGRGASVVDFIKKGETTGKVSITLINEGINAYRKGLYGNRITITRTLSKGSANSYVCKSQTGSVVSRKKEEVEQIVLTFNLQIKNPICILNQDMARSFLCCSDNSVRFAMFAKATQLEHLKAIYMKTLELLLAAKNQLKIKERGIEDASREITQLREKLSVFASLEKHILERTLLENEYVWSLVTDEENKLKRLNSDRTELERRKRKVIEGELNFKRNLKKLEDEVQEFANRLERVIASRTERKDMKYDLLKEIHDIEREMDKTELSYKHLEGRLERQMVDINAVKEHLARNDMLINQSEAESRAINEKINRLSEELLNVKQKLSETQIGYNEAQESKFQQTRNLENLKSDLGELEQNIKQLEVLLTSAKAKIQNNLLKYGPFTPELIAAINEAARKNCFSKKPIGPCGLYVSLSGDQKWARAVESVIGGLMTTYCCDNQKDFQTLSRIMDKVCGNKQPPIIISRFIRGRHNVEREKVRMSGVKSVLDVLSFDNDVVFNTFIDQARLETILLFETDSQAASVLTHVQNVPKNLRMGLTIQSDQYYPAPNYRTYYGDSRKPLKYFDGGSKTDSIKSLEIELKETKIATAEKNVEVVRAKEDYLDVCESLKRFEKKIREFKMSERKIQTEINHLRDIEESRPVLMTKVVMEEELRNITKAYDETAAKASECKEMLDSLSAKKIETEKTLNSLATEERGSGKVIRDLEHKLDDKKFRLIQMSGKKIDNTTQLAKYDRKIHHMDEEIRKSEANLALKVKSARDVCQGRVETDRAPMEVERLLEKCERYLKAAEKIAGSRKTAITEYKNKVEVFNAMRKTEGVLANAMDTLTKIALMKEQRLGVLQSHTASLVSFYFQATLQTRGYDGELKVDFENKILDLEVTPKDATIARKDAKTLSGGERSYSTVSFILAIWKVVQMPIYFLDEFDVFMDKVNRKVIIDLLLEHAQAQTNKQFVFITPQEISSIKSSEIVSIFKLPDPERTRS